SLRDTGTLVEIDHPVRGKYLSVGNPIKLSDSPTVVERSPLLGEHTEEILREVLRLDEARIREIKASGALGGAVAGGAEQPGTGAGHGGRSQGLPAAWIQKKREEETFRR